MEGAGIGARWESAQYASGTGSSPGTDLKKKKKSKVEIVPADTDCN